MKVDVSRPWVPIRGLVRLVERSPNARAAGKRYSDDQPRDDHGRWEGGGGGDDSDSGGGGGGGSSGGGGASTYQPITEEQARGDSRPVSAQEFQALAQEGEARLNELAANSSPTTGLDNNFDQVKADAYQAVQAVLGRYDDRRAYGRTRGD